MIAAVTGGRDLIVTRALADAFGRAIELRAGIRVLRHGGARGADEWAATVAPWLGLAVECWPADWATHGRAAGPIRNRAMLEGRYGIDVAPVFVLLAFPGGRGTADCVRAAHELGIPVVELIHGGM